MTIARPGGTGTSPFDTSVAPITASDDEIRAYLEEAEVPPLLPALAYATGDLSLLRDDLRPDPCWWPCPRAAWARTSWRRPGSWPRRRSSASGTPARPRRPPPSDDLLLRIMEFAVGGAEMAEYLPLLEEELAYRGEDRRAPGWQKDEVAPDVDFRVAVIGAGMSGLLAAHRLAQAGVDFVILEKDHDVGGTWLENTYPGCRVDNPNHNYSYAFAQRHDWPLHFSTQDVLLDYFRRCADAFGLRQHIRFGTEVVSAEWSEAEGQWTVRVRSGRDGDGDEETLTANAVVSAVGQLNRPRYPTDIAGYGSFAGPAFHSARWDHDLDLAGKRVAVIGTGASAVQFIPEIAPEVGELAGVPAHAAMAGPHARLPRRGVGRPAVALPPRALLQPSSTASGSSGAWATARCRCAGRRGVRAQGPSRERGQRLRPDDVRRLHEGEFADRPDLLEAVLPAYPLGAKRMLRDNGIWARALKRDNVRLVTDDIERSPPPGSSPRTARSTRST